MGRPNRSKYQKGKGREWNVVIGSGGSNTVMWIMYTNRLNARDAQNSVLEVAVLGSMDETKQLVVVVVIVVVVVVNVLVVLWWWWWWWWLTVSTAIIQSVCIQRGPVHYCFPKHKIWHAVYIFDHRLHSYIWLPACITNIYVGLESNSVWILHIICYS